MEVFSVELLSVEKSINFCPSDQRAAKGTKVKCIATYAGKGECGKYLTLDSYFNVQPVLLLLK